MRFIPFFIAIPLAFACQLTCAEPSGGKLLRSVDFKATAVPDKEQRLKEVHMQSGMGWKLANPVLDLAIKYDLKGAVKGSSTEGVLDQVLSTQLRSGFLNDLLDVDAALAADRVARAGSDAYRLQLAPRISKSLGSLAKLDLKYRYQIDHPEKSSVKENRDLQIDLHGRFGPDVKWKSSSYIREQASASEGQRTEGYAVDVNGKANDGRLTWRGTYRIDAIVSGSPVQQRQQNRETLDITTRYDVSPQLRFEFAGKTKAETSHDQQGRERLLKAGISWSPPGRYDLGLTLHRVQKGQGEEDIFGSGAITWRPESNVRFSVGYGANAVNGNDGILLSTRLVLRKS